jgi:trehalose/maltose hydrolase-like predicted phosphorylase
MHVHCTQAVMCAQVGIWELAHDYADEAALIDLRDGGVRDYDGIPAVELQLPEGISRLRFRLR